MTVVPNKGPIEEKIKKARLKLRELLARPGLTILPLAYDATSVRIIEAEGYEAIVGGGYADIGSMLAQADMG